MRPAHGSDILLLCQAVFGCPLRYGEVFIPGARRSNLIEPHIELTAVCYQPSANSYQHFYSLNQFLKNIMCET